MKYWILLLLLSGVMILSGCCCSERHEQVVLSGNSVLIDVRSNDEFAAGHLADALNIPHDTIGKNISKAAPDKSAELYLYCRSGRRVKIAISSLEKLGYKNLHDLGGMEEAARATGRKIVK